MSRPHFLLEDAQSGLVCGIDEVGRGPLAGPVVAAAVTIDRQSIPDSILSVIDDSKKVSAKKRAQLALALPDYCDCAIAACSVEEIDDLNILQASLLAMARAYHDLRQIPDTALVDGNKAPKLPCHTQTVIKGDSVSLSIAAASIIAKHHRDTLMASHAEEFPQYGWETNAGYGTAKHLKAIEIHGITPYHRLSFAPVHKRSLQQSSANS